MRSPLSIIRAAHGAGRETFRSRFVLPAPGGARWVSWLVVALTVLLPILATVPSATGAGRLPFGTHVAGVNVGRQDAESATAALERRASELMANPVVFALGGERWSASPAELGVAFDIPGTVERAMTADTGTSIDLIATFDPQVFGAFVERVESSRLSPAVDASIKLDGTEVKVTPSHEGEVINQTTLQSDLQSALNKPGTTLEVVATRGDASITTAEADETAEQIRAMLDEPFVFELNDQRWTLRPEQIAPALVITPIASGRLDISLDMDRLAKAINPVIEEAETARAADATVEDFGTHTKLVESVPSVKIDRTALASGLQRSLLAGNHRMTMPAEVGEPRVTTEDLAAEMGLTEVIATGTSDFSGSGEGRYHNVVTATDLIDGTLVAPGGTYSFHDSVGSLFSGDFVDAGSYIDGPTGQSLAGGVCQVSTTVFRAALNAGLPIIEWWPHGYRTVYYEQGGWSAGFDAAIMQIGNVPETGGDFRFTNPTDAWLLVRASTSAEGELTVELVADKDPGYTVEIEEPVVEVVEYAPSEPMVLVDEALPRGTIREQEAMDGLRVIVIRNVYDADGELLSSDTFVSTYMALQPVRRVSPDMETAASN